MGKSVGHEQRPAYYDDLPADFTLAASGRICPGAGSGYVPPAVVAPEPARTSLSEEQAYKMAENIASMDAWNAFLSQYPDGAYSPYAKAAREKLVAAAVSKQPAPEPQQQAALPPKTKSLPEPTVNSCRSSGKVRGLDPNGDNFLSIRTGPGTGFREIDRLYTGNRVSICGKQGSWLKIRYSGGHAWVHGRYVAR